MAMLGGGLLLSVVSDPGDGGKPADDDDYVEIDPDEEELNSDQLIETEDGVPADPDVVPSSDGDEASKSIKLTSGDDDYSGTAADEHIIGGKGDDTIFGNGGVDRLGGWGGDDELISHGNGGRLAGNQGDDYLEAKKTGYGQYHIFGADGEDTIVMHLDNNPGWGHQGFHAHGGDDADEFRFVGAGTTNEPMMSRLEDFDPSQDSIWVDDEEIDLEALPSNMRIVDFHEQQWLVIDDNVMIGLEGA